MNIHVQVKKVIVEGTDKRVYKVEDEAIQLSEIKSYRPWGMSDEEKRELENVEAMTLIYFHKKNDENMRAPQMKIAEDFNHFLERIGSIAL